MPWTKGGFHHGATLQDAAHGLGFVGADDPRTAVTDAPYVPLTDGHWWLETAPGAEPGDPFVAVALHAYDLAADAYVTVLSAADGAAQAEAILALQAALADETAARVAADAAHAAALAAAAVARRQRYAFGTWGDRVNPPVPGTGHLFPIRVASTWRGWQLFADEPVTGALQVEYVAADGTVTDLVGAGTAPALAAARAASDMDGDALPVDATALAAGGALRVTLAADADVGDALLIGADMWIEEAP